MGEPKQDFKELIDMKKLKDYAQIQRIIFYNSLREEDYTKSTTTAKNMQKVVQNFHKKIKIADNQQPDYNSLHAEWNLMEILVSLWKGTIKFSNLSIIKDITTYMLQNRSLEFLNYQFFEAFLKHKQFECARIFLICSANCEVVLKKNYTSKMATSSKELLLGLEIYLFYMQCRIRKAELVFTIARIEHFVINETSTSCQEDRTRQEQLDKKNASVLQYILPAEKRTQEDFDIEKFCNLKQLYKAIHENMKFLGSNQEKIAKIMAHHQLKSNYTFSNLNLDDIFMDKMYYGALALIDQDKWRAVILFSKSMVIITNFVRKRNKKFLIT